jgi:DNA-binding response OmpR family regulator
MQIGRIIVVAVDPIVGLLLRWVLENQAHEVREASDLADALTQIESWNPDVVVLAWPGPAELLAELRELVEGPDIIVATDFGVIIEGAAAVVPLYDDRKLVEQVEALLRSRSDDHRQRSRREPQLP